MTSDVNIDVSQRKKPERLKTISVRDFASDKLLVTSLCRCQQFTVFSE